MDISLPPLAPRAAPDLRPAADAAASARITRPAAAVAVTDPALVSATQMGLVNQSLIATEARGVAPVRAVEAVDRVLKPYGVSMLPSRAREEHEPPEAEEPEADAADAEAGEAEAPPAPDRAALGAPVAPKVEPEPEPA